MDIRVWHRFVAVLRRWVSGDRLEQDLHDEVESYAAMLEDEHRAAGLTAVEARRQARLDIGGIAQVEERVRDARAAAWFEQTSKDLGYAVRGLRRGGATTLTVILTLGLGLGANIAVFSVLDASLLKPLPYDHPDELVDLGHRVHVDTKDERTMV